MKVIIMVCTKKTFIQDKWAILDPKMAHPLNSGSALRIILKFCTMKGADSYIKFLSCFLRKNLICGNLIFLGHFLLFDWA